MFAESSLLDKGVSGSTTAMVTVRDLINYAMGPPEGNKVNFKLIQKILHILARQLRIQEQYVDLGYEKLSSIINGDPNKQSKGNIGQNQEAKEKYTLDIDRQKKEHKNEREEKEKAELLIDKERAEYERQKAKEQDMEGKENTKLEKMADKEGSEDFGSHVSKEPDINEKENANLANIPEKVTAEYERKNLKEQDFEEREKSKLANITDQKRAEYESQKTKEQEMEKMAKLAKINDEEKAAESESRKTKERDIKENENVKSPKPTEKESAEYESQKANERDIREKEIAKSPKITDKENAEYESQKAKERHIEENEKINLAKITDEEKIEYERQKAKERDMEEKAKLAKITDTERAESESKKIKEQDLKEKVQLEKINDKERTENQNQKAKEGEMEENAKLAKLTKNEKAEYEIQKTKEQDLKENEKVKLAKITDTEKVEYERQKAKEQDIEEKEKARLAKSTDEERVQYKSNKAWDMEEKAKMSDKEIVVHEIQKAKEQVMEEMNVANLEEMSDKVRAVYESFKARQQAMEEKQKDMKAKVSEKKKMRGTSVTDSLPRVGSVEVVTRSEFDLLEERVENLEERVARIPYPSLSLMFNQRQELSVSSLSFTESMQAIQMMTRVEAAEEAVTRMADVLTTLLVESADSNEVAGRVKRASAGIGGAYDASTKVKPVINGREASKVAQKGSEKIQIGSLSRLSSGSQEYRTKSNPTEDQPSEEEERRISLKLPAFVTHAELDYALRVLKDAMIKNANEKVLKTHKTAETAYYTVQSLVDVTNYLTDIDTRMINLHLLVDDYALQLASFDTVGIEAQLASFYSQLNAARSQLEESVTCFEKTMNRETEDVKNLKSWYDELVAMLGMTSWSHKQLTANQKELADELKKQQELIEMLGENKVDIDMVMDALQDKADRSDLKGLMHETEFKISRAGMERSLRTVQDKFDLQCRAWIHVINELTEAEKLRANITMLLTYKAETEEQLTQLQQGLNMITTVLTGPQAVLLIRRLKEGGLCGACSMDAIQMSDVTLIPRLPVFGRHFPTKEVVCETSGPPPPPPLNERQHICRRWVGGSHTTITDAARTEAPKLVHHPTKKYTGFGDDGKIYKMEELLPPCSECNQPDDDVAGILVDEAGDTGMTKKSDVVKSKKRQH